MVPAADPAVISAEDFQRVCRPDEVAETICWSTTGASMMTGAIVELDIRIRLNAI